MTRPAIESSEEAADVGLIEEVPLTVGGGGLRAWFSQHGTISYLIRRLVLYLFTMWAAFSATFFFFRLIPGNPIAHYIANLPVTTTAGKKLLSHYDHAFDLDGNAFQQYVAYMYQLVVKHDMGPSLIAYPTPSLVLVAHSILWTIGLLGTSALIAWILGIILGAFAGWRRNSPVSRVLTYCALATSNLPFFFVAIVLLFIFAFDLNWLPLTYAYGPGMQLELSLPFILSLLNHALIPGGALVLVSMFTNFLTMRQQMITVLGEDYMTFASAKGLRPWHVLRRYGMPNCYLPQITGLVINLGFVFSGNIILEQIFIYPGVGHLLGEALRAQDYNTLMAITDVIIFMVLSAVFLIDMALPLLDPRIRHNR
ncbi:MAG TPA: ABC transporter permease [Candidatus Dormibacteraeota bacterium]|jgi:peptide/nickel transport system permease protein|nr:ABC transporter permease [Candidatus Dormibacteraeota bacterium]